MTATKPKPTYIKGSLYQIPLADLKSDPNQPRKFFDLEALEDLESSIKNQGVLQPVLFRVDHDGNLYIVAGERRLQAAKKAKLKTIPSIFVDGNYDEIALVENLLREDLTAIELAEALDLVMKEHSYTQEQLAGIIGKAKSTVSDILTLTKLPQEIRDECRNDPKISRQCLIEIARKKREKGMLTAYKKYKDRISSPRKTRGPKGGRTFETRYAFRFDKIKTFMTGIDLAKLDADKRTNLSALIEDLKKAADDFLKTIKKAPAYVKKEKLVMKAKRIPKQKTETAKKKPVVKTAKKSAK